MQFNCFSQNFKTIHCLQEKYISIEYFLGTGRKNNDSDINNIFPCILIMINNK